MDGLRPYSRQADDDEVDASSGASSRAPSKQSWTKCATPTTMRCHINSCMVFVAGLNKAGYRARTHCMHTAIAGASHHEERADCTTDTSAGPGNPQCVGPTH